jgi:hypothetical protein
VAAGEPAALKLFAEKYLFRAHQIDYRYTADGQHYAYAKRRFVSVPPPIDLTALAIIGHEVRHVLNGACPNTGQHRETVERGSSKCLQCEREAWDVACRLLPPLDKTAHARMQRALGSYRAGTSAPMGVQRETDRFLGTVAHAERRHRALRMEDRLATLARWNTSMERDRERRRKFEAKAAWLEHARRTL